MTPREKWKLAWRRIRIFRREYAKVQIDMIVFGTGAMLIPDDGSDPSHVPIEDLVMTSDRRSA